MVDDTAIARLVSGTGTCFYRIPEGPFHTIFLFGAGASYGCGDVYPHRPPLGNQLYEHLRVAFPDSWGALPSDLGDYFAINFEKGMDVLWKEHIDRSALLLQQMGIYFSRFAPATKHGTMFRKIVSRLIGRRANDVLLSTLNYDRLLDGELTRAGLSVNYMFPPGGVVPLIKLHGSCNWFIDMPGVNRYVNLSPTIRIEAPIRSVNSEKEVTRYLTGDTPFHPVICLYNQEKSAPLCRSFFEHLQKDWGERILTAQQVALVGVRPYPDDAHVWGPLAATHARVLCIGDRLAFEKWHEESGRVGETVVVDEFFEQGFGTLWESLRLQPANN